MQENISNVVLRDYNPNQTLFLPPSLEELLPANHPARTVSAIVDKLNIRPILEKYDGGGASSYHPRLLLKVLSVNRRLDGLKPVQGKSSPRPRAWKEEKSGQRM